MEWEGLSAPSALMGKGLAQRGQQAQRGYQDANLVLDSQ